ncbi:hypothetical protein ES705_43308 [subsurface metagenome]
MNTWRLILILKIQLLLIGILSTHAQKGGHSYQIDITGPDKNVYDDHLKLGGTNFLNESFSFNNYYMLMNDKPFIPVTGDVF